MTIVQAFTALLGEAFGLNMSQTHTIQLIAQKTILPHNRTRRAGYLNN